METPNFFKENKEESKKELSSILLEIDSDIKRFGGVQKFVLLESSEGFHFGTSPSPKHLSIKKQIEESLSLELENRGGGFLAFSEENIEIMNKSSRDLGPLQISRDDLEVLLQDKLGDYNLKQSEA